MAGTGERIADITEAMVVDALLGVSGEDARLISIDRLIALVSARLGPTYATLAKLAADLAWP